MVRKFCAKWELSLKADSMLHVEGGPARPSEMKEQDADSGCWSLDPVGMQR